VIEVALPAFAADRRAAAQLLLRVRACCTARPMRDITNRALGSKPAAAAAACGAHMM